MSTRVADRVTDWDTRSFDGGYRELHDMAEEGFSGVVRAGGTELFMTKGVVVGILGGSVEAFEDTTGTAYEAPSPALPVLAVMQAKEEDVRGQYYSEKTSLSEVDTKLSDGGFTGYIELSENVLSGDYYQVYHAGRSMSVAFIGQSSRLIDGDEAFETADDEVGIYEVRAVDLDPIEVPEPPEPGSQDAPESTADSDDGTEEAVTGSPSETDTEVPPEPTVPGDSPEPDSPPTDDDRDESGTVALEDTPQGSGRHSEASGGDDLGVSGREHSPPQRPDVDGSSPRRKTRDGRRTSGARTESEALATRAVPSLDPARTRTDDTDTQSARDAMARDRKGGERGSQGGAVARQRPKEVGTEADQTRQETAEPESAGQSAEASEQVAKLESELEERAEEIDSLEAEVDELESELETVTDERDELSAELEEVRSERAELVEEVDDLETELDRLETELGAATDTERQISAEEALVGTDIFVRYESKKDATLETARDGKVPAADVAENIRLEHHTQFDAEAVGVSGQTYTQFIQGTLEYQFVNWLVHDLLFEIRDTGHRKGLKDLYEAISEVDRAELSGTVDVVYSDNGQETESQETFDVVLRNRMGDPLIAATLNDSREGATGHKMEDLVTASERLGQCCDDFAASFLVTASFFEPDALEIARGATSGGLLSRSKRKSFVNISRKQGFHICLVEARNDKFNLAVPELQN